MSSGMGGFVVGRVVSDIVRNRCAHGFFSNFLRGDFSVPSILW